MNSFSFLSIFFCILTCILGLGKYTSNDPCQLPMIYEYLQSYKIDVNDLKDVAADQLSKITIPNISSPLVNKTTVIIEPNFVIFEWNGSNRTINNDLLNTSIVKNDELIFTQNYQAYFETKKTIGKNITNQYNVTTTGTVIINYSKTIDLFNQGQKNITNFTLQFNPENLITNISQQISPENKTKIFLLINGTNNDTFYLQLKKLVDKIQSFMYDNLNKQRSEISPLYTDSTYSYIYENVQNTTIKIETKTRSLKQYSQKILRNGISATIDSTSNCPQNQPDILQNYNYFYTCQFVQNLITAAINTSLWNNISVDRSWVQDPGFQFRLIDLQYVMPDAVWNNSKQYHDDLIVICSILSAQTQIMDQKGILHNQSWSCSCNLNQTQLTQFTAKISHLITLQTSNNSVKVKIQETNLIGNVQTFSPKYEIINQNLLNKYVQNIARTLKISTIFGDKFKINSTITQFSYINTSIYSGIWMQ